MKKTAHLELLPERVFHAVELEEAILGAMMIEKAACYDVIRILKEEHFYHASHRLIYRAINRLAHANRPIDILTVTQDLKAHKELDAIENGPYYITVLTNRVASAANIEYHARVVMEQWIQRELNTISLQIRHDAEHGDDILINLKKATDAIEYLNNSLGAKGIKTTWDLAKQMVEDIKEKKLTGKRDSLTVPFSNVNQKLAGLRAGKLYILAARPGIGKTALAMQIALAISKETKVAFFSLEMSAEELIQRIASNELEIDSSRIQNGSLTPEEIEVLEEYSRQINANLHIDDTPGLSMHALRLKAVNMKLTSNIELLVVDYLQLMESSSQRYGTNRESDIAEISRGLKKIAKELKIPVLALSQLSREAEKRKAGRPQLSDLRESGAIEQDADVVIMMYQPEKYIDKEEFKEMIANGEATQGETELIFRKNRGGSIGSEVLQFIPEYTKFKMISESEASDYDNNEELKF